MKQGQLQRSKQFDIAKQNIKTFSEKIPHNVSLPKVQEDAFFGIFDKKVTGREMNTLVRSVQDTFIKSNNVIKDIVKEFNEVYTALDVLDKDYIQTFLVHIKAIEKNNKDISNANKDIYKAQKDIQATIQGLKITINKLSEFKDNHNNDVKNIHNAINVINKKTTELYENLEYAKEIKEIFDNHHHLKDINTIWQDIQNHKDRIQTLNQKLSENYNTINDRLEETNAEIGNINTYLETLQKIEHLQDIDTIWQDIQNHKGRIQSLNQKLSENYNAINDRLEETNTKIGNINTYLETLQKIEHLQDIDTIWQDIQNHKGRIQSLNQELSENYNSLNGKLEQTNAEIGNINTYLETLQKIEHLQDIDTIWQDIQNHKDRLQQTENKIKNLYIMIIVLALFLAGQIIFNFLK